MNAATIVVGVDTHHTWPEAVDWATDLALLERRELTLVHVADASEELWHDAAGRETRIGVRQGPTEGDQLLAEARARIARRAPSVPVRTALRGGGVRSALYEAAQDAHLLVVGSHHPRTWWSHLFGTTASAITRRPPCPVVVVHGAASEAGPDATGPSILVGIDDTEHSTAALTFAFRQASQRRLPLDVVHVAPEATYGEPVDEPEQRLAVSESISGFRYEFPDVHVRTRVARGVPSAALLDAGRTAQLIVLGVHHRRPFWDLLLGSVVAPVVEQAACPVAVVPDEALTGPMAPPAHA